MPTPASSRRRHSWSRSLAATSSAAPLRGPFGHAGSWITAMRCGTLVAAKTSRAQESWAAGTRWRAAVRPTAATGPTSRQKARPSCPRGAPRTAGTFSRQQSSRFPVGVFSQQLPGIKTKLDNADRACSPCGHTALKSASRRKPPDAMPNGFCLIRFARDVACPEARWRTTALIEHFPAGTCLKITPYEVDAGDYAGGTRTWPMDSGRSPTSRSRYRRSEISSRSPSTRAAR